MIDDGGFAYCQLQDEGIIYNGYIKEVKSIIQELDELGLEMDGVRDEVRVIEESISNQVKYNYDTYSDGNSSFLQSGLRIEYSAAINKLEAIKSDLIQEWNDYYKIVNKCNDIHNIIQDFNEIDYEQVVDKLIEILRIMRESSTINFEMEENIVNRLYNLIYHVMKMEMVYTNNSILLNYIKNNDTDSSYIAELLKKEISEINNEEVSKMLSALQSEGISTSNLLNERLILLVTAASNPEVLSVVEKKCNVNREELDKIIREINNNQELLKRDENSLNNINRDISDLHRKKRIKTLKGMANGIVLALCLSTSVLAAKKFGTVKEYHTTTTTYDSSMDSTTVTESYSRGKNNDLKIQEFTPWSEPSFFRDSKYERDVYNYYVSEKDYDMYSDLEQYLNSNMNGRYQCKSKTEYQKEKPDDFGYLGNRYIITRTEKDLEDYKNGKSPVLFAVTLTISLLGTAVMELLYFKKIAEDKYVIIKKEITCALDKKKEKEEAINNYKNTLRELNVKKEQMEKIIEDDSMTLLSLKKSILESDENGSKLTKTL